MSAHDTTPQIAWCWATGLIEIGDALPPDSKDGSGAIEIARGPKAALEEVLSAVARHGYRKGVLLVPGVPEAEDQREEVEALANWLDWCAKSNGKQHRNGVVFSTGAKR